MIDLSINVGQIVTVAVFGAGLIATFVTMRNTVSELKEDLVDLKKEMKKIGDVLVEVARQDERLSSIDQRMLMQGQRLDEAVRRINGLLDRASVG